MSEIFHKQRTTLMYLQVFQLLNPGARFRSIQKNVVFYISLLILVATEMSIILRCMCANFRLIGVHQGHNCMILKTVTTKNDYFRTILGTNYQSQSQWTGLSGPGLLLHYRGWSTLPQHFSQQIIWCVFSINNMSLCTSDPLRLN